GLLGLSTLALGLAGWLQTAVLLPLLVLASLAAAPQTLSRLRAWRQAPPAASAPRLVRLYLGATLLLALFVALLPPTSWDGLFYHLTGPRLYLQAGAIRPGIDVPHFNFPALFEMLFLLAMAVRGDVAAKLLHFLFALLLAGWAAAAARRHLGMAHGWRAVLLLLAAPMTLSLAGWAYNDLALAFYQVTALSALLAWRRQPHRGWLWLSGILCGLAMGLKYTSFIAPLFLAGLLAWHVRRRPAAGIRPLLELTAVTTLVAAPWYLKNWLFTGNPTYPFVFGGRFWDDFRAAAYAGAGTGIGWDPITLLRLPHDMLLGLQDASQDVTTGPLFLMFLPLLLAAVLPRWRRRLPADAGALLAFVLVQYLFWMLGAVSSAGLWQSRLLLPAFAALCPLLAWLWHDLARFDHPQFSLQRFVNLTVALALALGLLGQTLAWLPRAPWTYTLGSTTRAEVLARDLGAHYAALTGLTDVLPPDAVVVFLFEPRSYYCAVDCRPDSILDTLAHLEHVHAGDAAAIAAAWRAAGVSHILLFESGYDFVVAADTPYVAPQDPALWSRLQAHLRRVADWHGAYTLYELLP
ncbi:MAG: glycosyltransferase family 39 protein, partial [Anaerolineales bacterium]|nr:glycosyltransferase family 39 protein [Anaerolineales bacterium]